MMETQKKEIEEKVGEKELTSEIALLLKDYFIASVTLSDGGIGMNFPDGQKF